MLTTQMVLMRVKLEPPGPHMLWSNRCCTVYNMRLASLFFPSCGRCRGRDRRRHDICAGLSCIFACKSFNCVLKCRVYVCMCVCVCLCVCVCVCVYACMFWREGRGDTGYVRIVRGVPLCPTIRFTCSVLWAMKHAKPNFEYDRIWYPFILFQSKICSFLLTSRIVSFHFRSSCLLHYTLAFAVPCNLWTPIMASGVRPPSGSGAG
jgi:hypothetical protein